MNKLFLIANIDVLASLNSNWMVSGKKNKFGSVEVLNTFQEKIAT
jgi:hypothetical protein